MSEIDVDPFKFYIDQKYSQAWKDGFNDGYRNEEPAKLRSADYYNGYIAGRKYAILGE